MSVIKLEQGTTKPIGFQNKFNSEIYNFVISVVSKSFIAKQKKPVEFSRAQWENINIKCLKFVEQKMSCMRVYRAVQKKMLRVFNGICPTRTKGI